LYILRFVDDPEWYGVCFRKTLKQLSRSLWKEAKSMYRPLLIHQTGKNKGKYKGKAKIIDSQGNYKITFPSGATVEFSYLTSEKDAVENWQGAQLSAAFFDEFTHFDEGSYNYIRTRMRSNSKYPSFIRCSMNPDPNHFVKSKYLEAFIIQDENDSRYGVLDRSLNGRLRYYVFDRGEIHTSWSEEDLIERFPQSKPRAYTAVSSSLVDNPLMLANNPEYADDLQANDPANAAMLLDGNWHYQKASNGIWERTTINEVTLAEVPNNLKLCRGWDKACVEKSKESSYDPDYTASVSIGKDVNKNYYVFGNYIKDEEDRQLSRFRKKVGARNQLILDQANLDGSDTIIVLPQDPAQAGKIELEQHSKDLQEEGFIVKKDPMAYNKGKIKKFEPFCAACHNGFVFFVTDSFDRKVLDYLYLELENFDGDKNNGYKDDLLDAAGSAFNFISRERVSKPVSIPNMNNPTLLAEHRNRTK
tara:strand:+ start:3084 stop:4505 length:1422 start_codon:yes stop_codon:yes gene_type:complete